MGLHGANVAQKEEIERERERVGSAQSKCGSEGRNRERGLGLRKVNVAQKEEIEAERVSEGWVCTE